MGFESPADEHPPPRCAMVAILRAPFPISHHERRLRVRTMTRFNDHSNKYNPFGTWEHRREIEQAVLLRASRRKEWRDVALTRLSRICACCHRPFVQSALPRHICSECARHLRCPCCKLNFDPSDGSSEMVCEFCWSLELKMTQALGGNPRSATQTRRAYRLAFASWTFYASREFGCAWRLTMPPDAPKALRPR